MQLASKNFLLVTQDNALWKELCFGRTPLKFEHKRLQYFKPQPIPIQEPRVFELQRAVARSEAYIGDDRRKEKDAPHQRAFANWDPTFLGEEVNWYNEYIARHAPLSLSWIEKPHGATGGARAALETRGLGFLDDGQNQVVIAPLEDASLCIWRVGAGDSTPNSKDGRILARSQTGLLSNGTSGSSRPHRIAYNGYVVSADTVECVSVDRIRNKAYFAVQSTLNEVDLTTLQVSSHQQYPFSISAISEASYPTPLTIGTTLSLHLHDPRIGGNGQASPYAYLKESIDNIPKSYSPSTITDFSRLHNGDSVSPPGYAPLEQPLPLSVVHTSTSPTIHVAGRFPSILQYDRRTFPKLNSTLYSGGSLCSLTSFPAASASTLAGAGEYNGKGSLELYPLDTATGPTRNRVSASSSKLLSIVRHGARLLFSDSDGQVKWVERDGSTLVRRWNINSYSQSTKEITPTQGIFNNEVTGGEVARKLIPVSDNERSEVLLWTGEKIGLLSIGRKERFMCNEDSEGDTSDGRGNSERDYGRMMRIALERQADEVRFVKGLGLGL